MNSSNSNAAERRMYSRLYEYSDALYSILIYVDSAFRLVYVSVCGAVRRAHWMMSMNVLVSGRTGVCDLRSENRTKMYTHCYFEWINVIPKTTAYTICCLINVSWIHLCFGKRIYIILHDIFAFIQIYIAQNCIRTVRLHRKMAL